ncbi:unnamed protein product [Rotaria socialis]|uniref:GH26 domain-containing protein n=4 Tax=Rotaria socialis TaxID=392032 RepID=A0A817VWS7_9BILA|nr:unnamed protein product [Rotaria socialis]CAF4378809.1 unnamed protein product [Rotaria socialis]
MYGDICSIILQIQNNYTINIIWVYSPDQSRANPSHYYPGYSYVDIVALDVYTDDPNSVKSYDEMLTLNKPFALAEVGPSTTNGGFDYTRWLTAMQSKFPGVADFLAWNDGWSPIKNQNVWALFNNQLVINRGKLNLGDGATSSASGGVLYNFSNGVGQWQGTNVTGGPEQSNEFVFQSTDSLKLDINLSQGRRYALYNQQQTSFQVSERKRLTLENVQLHGVLLIMVY